VVPAMTMPLRLPVGVDVETAAATLATMTEEELRALWSATHEAILAEFDHNGMRHLFIGLVAIRRARNQRRGPASAAP